MVVALAPCAAWLQVFVAAVWEGLTIALVPEAKSAEELAAIIAATDARTAVCELDNSDYFNADPYAGALSIPPLRKTRFASTPDARFLLRTSGTSGDVASGGRWIALSDANVLAVIDSHLPHLALVEETSRPPGGSRVLSVLPWNHAFGLVIDLLPAVFSGAEIHRDPHGGRDVSALLAMFAQTGITDCSMVPLTAKRFMATDAGLAFLRSLRGGVVGGAPVDAALAAFLSGTRLRVGYGQTEASPGIALGAPGYFPQAGYVGVAVGCETRIGDAGTLLFRGANACVSEWDARTGYVPLVPNDWRDTGDIVTKTSEGDLVFAGRVDSCFKLANGRRIVAEPLENALRGAIPYLENVIVWSADGETLQVASDQPLPRRSVVGALGTLDKLLGTVRVVPTATFAWTPKGTLKRRETLQNIAAG